MVRVKGVDLGNFPIMTFAEAMRRYGSDKPDLRNPMELVDVADIVKMLNLRVLRPSKRPERSCCGSESPRWRSYDP